MEFQDRWYQVDAADTTMLALAKGPDIHPLVVAPTGSGKTAIICHLIERIMNSNPLSKILILCHIGTVLKQDYKAVTQNFDGIPVGLYGNGLGSKTIRRITVAQINSVYKKSYLFNDFDIVIIDEAHAVTIEDEKVDFKEYGMYRRFLSEIKANYVGLTATHFRMGHGYIHIGEGTLFNHMAYDLSEMEKYNRLVDEGFLSQMFPKETSFKMDVAKLKTLGGDYSQKDMSNKLDRDHLTKAAVMETIHFGKNRKKWLCFAIDIKHCENVAKMFNDNGIPAIAAHSKSKENLDDVIEDYRNGKYKVLVSVEKLTTGFDVPEIDLLVIMRPTKSCRIHVQILGRGGRVVFAPGYDINTIPGRLEAIENSVKPNCLVLDFAGNIERLGPINDVRIKQKDKKDKSDEGPITKVCPECGIRNHGAVRECMNCGHKFEFKEKLQLTASADVIIKRDEKKEEVKKEIKKEIKKVVEKKKNLKEWARVDSVDYSRHLGRGGKPDSILVTYRSGIMRIKEWVAIEHSGYARYKAKNWINFRWSGSAVDSPETVHEFLSNLDRIKKPKEILAEKNGRYYQISDAKF